MKKKGKLSSRGVTVSFIVAAALLFTSCESWRFDDILAAADKIGDLHYAPYDAAADGKIPRSPVLLRRRTTPTFAAVARRHRLSLGWNAAVVEGRKSILLVSSDALKRYVEKQGKLEGRRFMESFMDGAKLNSEERMFILKKLWGQTPTSTSSMPTGRGEETTTLGVSCMTSTAATRAT